MQGKFLIQLFTISHSAWSSIYTTAAEIDYSFVCSFIHSSISTVLDQLLCASHSTSKGWHTTEHSLAGSWDQSMCFKHQMLWLLISLVGVKLRKFYKHLPFEESWGRGEQKSILKFSFGNSSWHWIMHFPDLSFFHRIAWFCEWKKNILFDT